VVSDDAEQLGGRYVYMKRQELDHQASLPIMTYALRLYCRRTMWCISLQQPLQRARALHSLHMNYENYSELRIPKIWL